MITAVREDAALPQGFQLKQNYPNPFNAQTTIAFMLSETTLVELVIYNASGQVVAHTIAGAEGRR
jgi:hypothetical protein